MKKIISLIICSLLMVSTMNAIPQKPTKPKLVNDFAGILDNNQNQTLEKALVEFNNSTTVQIAVVIVNDLEGQDKAMYAYEIGEKWGVGGSKFDNGVVILLKPKTAQSRGEVFIATGYGMEGVLPDAIAKRIVENEMIPAFKQNNYYGGLVNAIRVIMQISSGEYPAEQYKKDTRSEEAIGGGVFGTMLFFFILFSIISRLGRARRSSLGRGGLSTWILLGMLGSGGRSHGGSFGNFSSGGGSFGGFGGGSFGGGGAGGSW